MFHLLANEELGHRKKTFTDTVLGFVPLSMMSNLHISIAEGEYSFRTSIAVQISNT